MSFLGTRVSPARILAASLVGTAVEFYDFYIYATAASLVFGPLFFPAQAPSVQLMASYASFAVAFVARPIGAVVFGHFGDRMGRKSTLVASLLLMGGSTVAIGLLPTYQTVGWLAPLALCTLRFGQGFGLGGEWGGAALLAVENAPDTHVARYGMFPQLGAPVGFIASNGLFYLLGIWLVPDSFIGWGWRLPFLISSVLISIGLWVRLRLAETPVFAAALAAAPPPKVPVAELLRNLPREVAAGTFTVVACFAIFYLATAFALGYGTAMLGYDRKDFLATQLAAIPFMAIGIVMAGYWADTTNPRRVLMAGCFMTMVAGALLAPMLGSGSLFAVWAFLSLAFLAMGFVYGPLGAFLPSLFPARVRYTGASLSFNVGGILGGALAPILAQALATLGGLPYVGLYFGAAALVSLLGLAALKR
jgi:MFS family permease